MSRRGLFDRTTARTTLRGEPLETELEPRAMRAIQSSRMIGSRRRIADLIGASFPKEKEETAIKPRELKERMERMDLPRLTYALTGPHVDHPFLVF